MVHYSKPASCWQEALWEPVYNRSILSNVIANKKPCALVSKRKLSTGNGHYDDVMMGAMASKITSPTTVYSGAEESKHQSSASLAFVWGIYRGPVNSPHKWPATRKMFPFDDVIMKSADNPSSLLVYIVYGVSNDYFQCLKCFWYQRLFSTFTNNISKINLWAAMDLKTDANEILF